MKFKEIVLWIKRKFSKNKYYTYEQFQGTYSNATVTTLSCESLMESINALKNQEKKDEDGERQKFYIEWIKANTRYMLRFFPKWFYDGGT